MTPKSLLDKAVNYCLNQWTGLQNHIMDGNAEIDNNSVENGIRPFALGRRNWLFSGTPEGAQASALVFSLIETAKANGLKKWVAYAKKPFTGPEQVLKYLGRYTHRIAISNHRIKSIENGEIKFTYKNRQDNNKTKTLGDTSS